MNGFGLGRFIVLALAALLLLGAVIGLAVGGPAGVPGGLVNLVAGAVLVVAVVLERVRYRADGIDRANAPTGRAGGEPRGCTLEPRFQPTDERFEDPTTQARMRVWLDPRSGERRYVADD